MVRNISRTVRQSLIWILVAARGQKKNNAFYNAEIVSRFQTWNLINSVFICDLYPYFISFRFIETVPTRKIYKSRPKKYYVATCLMLFFAKYSAVQ